MLFDYNSIKLNCLRKTICLNMIVKNEAHIIAEMLEKLLNKMQIDYWVISDTGSSDNTKEIIKLFFKSKEIPGELLETEWRDFGYNRTIAMQNAYNKADYVFVWDADDEIIGDFQLPSNLTADSYDFNFGSLSGMRYSRPQLFKSSLRWKYIGVLHEMIGCDDPTTPAVHVPGDYYFLSGRSGNRSKNPNKYLHDAIVLEKAYSECLEKKDPLFNRYAFYCAQSYMDCNKYNKAIEFYKKVLNSENMNQEKYISCKNIHELYKIKGDEKEGLGYLVESHRYDSTRIECIYRLIVYYCCNNNYNAAYMYYTLIQDFFENNYTPNHLSYKLFANKNEYEFYLPYYMIIVGERTNHKDVCAKMCEIIAKYKCDQVNEFYIGNWIYNMQFFIDKVESNMSFRKDFTEYVSMLYKKGLKLDTVRSIIDRIKITNASNTSNTSNKSKMYVVNLKRRNDRKETMKELLAKEGIDDYTFFNAVDGIELSMTDDIKTMFKGNNFGFRRGVVGCALSHIQLWKQLIKDTSNEYYIVLEDDVTLCDNFKAKLETYTNSICENMDNWDVLFLGHHLKAHAINDRYVCSSNSQQPMADRSTSVGGTFGYIVHKKGAEKMVNIIETKGIIYSIDGFLTLTPEIKLWNVQPHLVFSDWTGINANVDTDIQHDYQCVAQP